MASCARAAAGTDMRLRQRIPLSLQFAALAIVYLVAAAAMAAVFVQWLRPVWAALLAVALLAPLLVYHVRRAFAPMNSLFRALAGSVASYHDGDYGFGLSWRGGGGIRGVGASHNALGAAVRAQRPSLVQRGLPLGPMGQKTPAGVALG